MNGTSAQSANGDIVIAVNHHLQRALYVWIFVAALVFAGLYVWLGRNPYLTDLRASASFWGWLAVVFGVPLLLIIVFIQKKVIFSTQERGVFSETLFGRKKLMEFTEIGAIKPYTDSLGGTYFALFGHNNLYQRNPPRVSPRFQPSARGDADLLAFEQSELPQLRRMADSSSATKTNRFDTLSDENLVYYKKEAGQYFLKDTYNRNSQKMTAVYAMLVVSVVILAVPSLRLPYFNFGVGAGLGALIVGFLMTERKYFKDGLLYSEFHAGTFQKSYPLAQFSRFQITHRRMNFIYVGTDINMLFWQANSSKPVFLCQLRKTNRVEALIRETEYILSQEVEKG